jgi:hypothetical protein
MGGSGAYLALGMIALPLALSLLFQLLAPRGSLEPLMSRLASSGQGSLIGLLVGMLVASTLVTGFLAGPLFSVPFAIVLIVVGLPASWKTGLGGVASTLTGICVTCLALGAVGAVTWAEMKDWPPPVHPERVATTLHVWQDARAIVADFPLLGVGLGSFSAVHPYYKTLDESLTTAMSSLLQWCVEAGAAGLVLVGVGAFWSVRRLRPAFRAVGTADRSLAFGLIGAAVGFGIFSVVHWTVELPSVALAASAIGGTGNRWLAGGTDLFVEHG